MKRQISLAVLLIFVFAALVSVPLGRAQAASDNACWGQATKVFAQTYDMGEHSSQQANPRLGLRNLARLLYSQGVLPDDTLQALGVFVADALGLSIEACQ